MFLANSFIGSFLLWVSHGGNMIRSRCPYTGKPHWVTLCRDGEVRHFQAVDSVLGEWLGWGYFEEI